MFHKDVKEPDKQVQEVQQVHQQQHEEIIVCIKKFFSFQQGNQSVVSITQSFHFSPFQILTLLSWFLTGF